MNTIDAAIRFLKKELKLSPEKENELMEKLYNFRLTQVLYCRNVRITCCVGDEESGWLLINSHFIEIGETIKFKNQEYVISKRICMQYKFENETMMQLEYIDV